MSWYHNSWCYMNWHHTELTQSAITCLKLTIETLMQGVKYVQS